MADAERESDHFLVRAKIRRNEKTKENEINEWPVGKLNKKEVKEELIKEVTINIKKYSVGKCGRCKLNIEQNQNGTYEIAGKIIGKGEKKNVE
jgi:hypothetical protein